MNKRKEMREVHAIMMAVFLSVVLTSCDTFWQGVGSYGNYGGYGMMGNAMFPGYVPPPTPPSAQQILNNAAQQVERQNQQEYQAAKRYRLI